MSEIKAGARPCSRREGILVREVLGDVVLYDTESHEAHSLNQAAAAVWRLADGTRTIEEIGEAGLGQLSPDVRRQAVLLAVQDLDRAGLLEASQDPFLPAPDLSRREMVRRVGYGVAVAALIPLVATLVAPKPAEASSLLGPGAPCLSSSQCASGLCVGGTCK